MAEILETSTEPFTPVDVDVVTLDLVENALRNARYEMDEVLFRTALSPGIREQHDEFPLIADRTGKMVAGQFGLSIPAFVDCFSGTIEEGDVLLTSDPYACDGAISHANDWLVVVPVFFGGRLVGWSAMFGHMSDVGGKTPSSMPTDAKTIFEEGVVIPPFKLYRRGVLSEDALEIILNQVRKPDWNRADLNGIVAACRTAGKRVQELCERFGVDTYTSALDALLDRNYRAMKTLLAMIFEDGETLTFRDYICDDGVGFGPYELVLSLTRHGDKVVLDFEGSAPQAKGPINYYINDNLVKMFFGIYMITVADPQILWNDGFYPLIDVKIPDGSFWKPKYPAALNARNHGIGRVFDLFGGLLGQKNPDLLNAAGFSSSPHFMYSGTTARASAPASGSSSTRSASAGSPAARSGTARTATPSGRRSSTSPASTSSPTTRCGSRSGRPSPTPAARACTAVATGWTSRTTSSRRGPSPSTTTGGSPTPGA
jgi:N-methylhydantoinase B